MQRPRVYSRVLVLVLTGWTVGCGGSDTPTAPSAPPPPPTVQIAGGWSGTFEARNYAPTALTVQINQTGTTVSGTWASTTGNVVESGTISGTVDASSFTGTISYAFGNGPTCQGAFAGSATATAIFWSSPGFTGNCGLANPGNPVDVRFVLQKR